MALEYTLSLGTELSPGEVLARMFGEHAAVVSSRANSPSTLELPEFLALAARLAQGDSVLKDALGIDPTVSVLFRLDKFGDLEKAKARVLAATLALAHAVRSDFVLLFNGETIILLRRGGVVVINERAGFWEGGLAAALDLPHSREALEPL